MKSFWEKYSEIIIIAFIILAVVIIIYWQGTKKGKKTAEGPQVDYPKGGSTIPAGWDPVPIVDELKDVMSGFFSTSGRKDDAWKKLRDLPTDEMIIAVYNAFNQKYFSEGKGTLSQWIRDENYYDYFTGVKDSTLARLQRLNLP